jgi:hypothetical protein
MTNPKANNRRAEAQRSRRLAASLSQPADQDRLKQYAAELERKAAKEDAGHANTRPDMQAKAIDGDRGYLGDRVRRSPLARPGVRAFIRR